MKIQVYTVITVDYDNLRAPRCEADPSAAWWCFTDRPRQVAPWVTQPCPQWLRSPQADSRIVKILPHLWIDADFSIYHDGAFCLTQTPAEVVRHLGDADLMLFRHPAHRSYLEERDFYLRQHGEVPETIERQAEDYLRRGLPPDAGWWAGGVLVRRHNAAIEAFNERWMAEYLRGGNDHNDQFGLYAAIVQSGIAVRELAGSYLESKWLSYHLHASSGCQDNPDYEAENRLWSGRRDRARRLCGLSD